ncbi:MAG TPA: hypothetical protein VGK73_07370, partial [Polyangiaceae bacterium]
CGPPFRRKSPSKAAGAGCAERSLLLVLALLLSGNLRRCGGDSAGDGERFYLGAVLALVLAVRREEASPALLVTSVLPASPAVDLAPTRSRSASFRVRSDDQSLRPEPRESLHGEVEAR